MIFFHSFNKACFSSATDLNRRLLTRLLRTFLIVFDEFKSNDCEEWDNLLIKYVMKTSYDD